MTTLYNILKEVRPRRVLFTSYTYSSIWFEAGPYPLLRREDCEQITVMLDAREARHSVDNTTSRFGGSRYRVIGTTPTGEGAGIFHPKIAYLEANEGDVLVVGSGNLTARGQTYALEVLDAVSATQEPLVFGQIADFFELLPERLSLLTKRDRDILASFAARARSQMEEYRPAVSAEQSTWLVATVLESAGAQFAELARQLIPTPKTLTVLSPFFDQDVSAVIRLRDKLGLKKVRYGLGREDDKLIAPFRKDIKKDKPKHFVEPPDSTRPLHAKWFEVTDESGAALVMTGSVNATQQSLWNTNNIEVSLVRHVPLATTIHWRVTDEEPDYVPCEYPSPVAAEDAVNCVASITRDNVLEVRFSPIPEQQEVKLDLHYGGKRPQPPLMASLDYTGLASVRVGSKLVHDLPDMALWLTASGKGFEVTTWVNVEPQLSAKPSQVDLYKSIGRIEADIADEEDAYLLFDAAHVLLTHRKLNGNRKPKKKEEKPSEGGVEDLIVTEAEWQAGEGGDGESPRQPSSEAVRIFKALGKLLELSNEELLKVLSSNANSAEPAGDAEEEADDGLDEEDDDTDDETSEETDDQTSPEDRKRERNRRKVRDSLAQARAAVLLAIDRRLAEPIPDALAMLIVPLKIRDRLHEGAPKEFRKVDTGREPIAGQDTKLASGYLMGLLSTLGGLRFGPKAIESLMPMVASAGAITGLCLERRALSVNYDQIHAYLEAFAGRQFSELDYNGMLEAEWRNTRFPVMRQFELSDLREWAGRIAQAPRLEDRIDSVLALALNTPKAPVPPEQCDVASVIQALRHPSAKYKLYSVLVSEQMPGHVGCPQCYASLDSDEVIKLKKFRMAVCKDRCKRPLFLKLGVAVGRQFLREAEAYVQDLRAREDGLVLAQEKGEVRC